MQFTKYHLTGLVVILVLAIMALGLLNSSFIASFFGSKNFVEQIKSANNPGEIQEVVVKKVVDGDTIELTNGATVRYLNVDTPETKKPNTPVMCFGPEASSKNSELVKDKTIWIKSDKEDSDRYGRKLRFIFLNKNETNQIEKSVNAILVKQGFGRTMIIKPNNTFERVFKSLEFEAKNNKVGVWANCSKPFEV